MSQQENQGPTLNDVFTGIVSGITDMKNGILALQSQVKSLQDECTKKDIEIETLKNG